MSNMKVKILRDITLGDLVGYGKDNHVTKHIMDELGVDLYTPLYRAGDVCELRRDYVIGDGEAVVWQADRREWWYLETSTVELLPA